MGEGNRPGMEFMMPKRHIPDIAKATLLATTLAVGADCGPTDEKREESHSGAHEKKTRPTEKKKPDVPVEKKPEKKDSSKSLEKKEKKSEKLPAIELGGTILGKEFSHSLEHISETQNLTTADKKRAIARWNGIVGEVRTKLLHDKYHAKSFKDKTPKEFFDKWLSSEIGKETIRLLTKYCDGQDGRPGPEYRNMFLALIIIESDGNPNLVQPGSGAIGLSQAMPEVAVDIGIIPSQGDKDKLKDPETNIKYLIKLWWKMYHEDEHRGFGYATSIAYNEGEGNFKHQLRVIGEDILKIGRINDDSVVKKVLGRMTPARLYHIFKTHKFRSMVHPENGPRSYLDSARYAVNIAVIERHLSQRLAPKPAKKKSIALPKSTPKKIIPHEAAQNKFTKPNPGTRRSVKPVNRSRGR